MKAFILVHWEDDAVFMELAKCVREKASRYPYPQTEGDLKIK
jgi:hypothetical protein